MGAYSYFNRDPANIRNKPEFGGGAIMDIGCYPIQISRFLFGREPESATALIDRDPEMQTDRLSSVLLEFPSGHCVFHLQHATGALPKDPDSRNEGPDRDRSSVQRAARPKDPSVRGQRRGSVGERE